MYIYKITVTPLNQCYIGFDTKPSYKLSRWKAHCLLSLKLGNTKLYQAMNRYGVENCLIEVIEDNFESISKLALAEIAYIKKLDCYKNGLNSTPGGDGMGCHILNKLTDNDIIKIKSALGANFQEYNKSIKWANKTVEERKKLTEHLHTADVYQKKSKTLKEYYKTNPIKREKKKIGIVKWQQENYTQLCNTNKKNSLIGAAKVSKKLLVELPDGSMLYYPSKSEFLRQTGQWAKTILKKTAEGLLYNGYRAWEK